MARRFDGKSALVTGASLPDGIGAACARQLAAEGARVTVAARDADGLEAVVKEIREAGGDAGARATDLRTPEACEALIAETVLAQEGLDILVNNAGMNARGPVCEVEARDLAAVIQLNLVAPVMLTRLALPHLRSRLGAVVQVASIAGQIPLDGEAAYSASKVGLRFFTFALREELEGTGVRISVVSPGPVDTSFILQDPDHVPDLVFAQPMSSPAEVAEGILACLVDGRRELSIPRRTSLLARLGSAFPSLRHAIAPSMERRGAARKAAHLARRGR